MASTSPAAPLKERPPQYQPDRGEVMNFVHEATPIALAPGVEFRPLVSSHNGARNLTTGVVAFEPGASLPYHRHSFSESVTVLHGNAVMEAEGRRYQLGKLDNITLPPGVAHFLVNESSEQILLHIAMPTSTPTRELVDTPFEPQLMQEDVAGHPDAERVLRHATAPRYEANPGASFIDFFNLNLGCEEMSGGYGLFAPSAQLPCHLHDFDESISIVQGGATCVVEGNRYTLSDNATALVPRGRCHYFINESDAPMAMVWVYAGPLPERIVLEASLCNLPHAKNQSAAVNKEGME